jgi:NADPH:quinone reductase
VVIREGINSVKIVRFHTKGAPEVLAVEDCAQPIPGDAEVLIRVEAAGVNYGDTLRRSGRHYPLPTPLPYAPGTQVIGEIEALGNGVDLALLGRRVFAAVPSGGYADYAVGPAATCYDCPPTLAALEAIAIMDQGVTAALVLKVAGRIQAGDTVLVPAAAGGVGSLAVQLAKIYGASQVIGLASTVEKRILAQGCGADAVVDYTRDGWSEAVLEATCGKGVDLALEMTGGAVFHETLKAVKGQFGRVVIYGNASDQAVEFNPRALVGRNMSLTGFLLPAARALVPEILKELAYFVQDGLLKPAIGGVHALHEAATAHRALETRASTGSLVLVP